MFDRLISYHQGKVVSLPTTADFADLIIQSTNLSNVACHGKTRGRNFAETTGDQLDELHPPHCGRQLWREPFVYEINTIKHFSLLEGFLFLFIQLQ